MSGESSEDERFSDVAEALKCPKSLRAVQKELSNLPSTSKWLLILDNADNENEDYHRFFPSGNRGAILMTSRTHEHALLAKADCQAVLGSLKRPECIQLLQRSARLSEVTCDTEEYANCVKLVDHLESHTLAMVQAAAYILKRRLTITQYLEYIQGNGRQLLDIHHSEHSPYGTAYTTFRATIDFLEQPDGEEFDETSKDSLQLLNILATFPRLRIPLDILLDAWEGIRKAARTRKEYEDDSGLLTRWHTVRLPDFFQADKDVMKNRITEAVRRLDSLALVQEEPSTGLWKIVSIHSLVHGWAGGRQSEQNTDVELLRTAECIVALSNFEAMAWRP